MFSELTPALAQDEHDPPIRQPQGAGSIGDKKVIRQHIKPGAVSTIERAALVDQQVAPIRRGSLEVISRAKQLSSDLCSRIVKEYSFGTVHSSLS